MARTAIFCGSRRDGSRGQCIQVPKITVYQLPQSLLYANAINRYLINSAILPASSATGRGESKSPSSTICRQRIWNPTGCCARRSILEQRCVSIGPSLQGSTAHGKSHRYEAENLVED